MYVLAREANLILFPARFHCLCSGRRYHQKAHIPDGVQFQTKPETELTK
jgi:hypothetical protein